MSLTASRAVLMEFAHPLVAAGVTRHSNFRRNLFARLYRTSLAANDLTFGRMATAKRAAAHIHHCHRQVRGSLTEAMGAFPQGKQYGANDPQLKLWVLATLIDSTLLAYDLFIHPLCREEKEAYYQDSKRLGRLLGIPSGVMPAQYSDFAAYVEAMVSGDALEVTDTARELSRALFSPPLIGQLAFALSSASIGLLPDKLREGYGFEWNSEKEEQLRRWAKRCRRLRRRLPDFLCVAPRALIAEWRLRRHERRLLSVAESG